LRQYFFAKKLPSQTVTREKPHKTLLYEKDVQKMLMKLTTVCSENKRGTMFTIE